MPDNNYFTRYIPLLIQVIVAIGLATVMVTLSHLLGKHKWTRAKNTAYECGINPTGDAQQLYGFRRQRGQRHVVGQEFGTQAVDLTEPVEVGRVATEAGQQRHHEGVLVRGGQVGVGEALDADAAGAFGARGRGAEGSRSVRGIDRGGVGKAGQTLERAVLRARQARGVLRP